MRPKTPPLLVSLAIGSLLAGCSINISTPVPPTSAAAVTPQQPVAVPTSQQIAAPSPQPMVTTIPMTWSSLHLGGRLIFTAGIYIGNDGYIDVSSLDLATGAIEPIFQTPDAGWVDSAAVSPDGTQMVISYAPPVSAPHGGQETLYALPTDGSKPAQLLFPPADPKDQNAQVVWAPDGKNLYFAHMNYHSPGPLSIWRVAYPDGAPQKLLDNAYWPRLSDDATRLTYVTLDPQTGQNYLYVANADGTGALEVPVQGPYISNVIDVPMFSPDGQSILFSAQDPPQSSILRGLDSILGAGLVHLSDGSIPSDWWSVPITGGAPKQLTHLGALSLYGGYSPDKQYIVSSSVNGIFIMRPDGSSLTMIVPDIGGIPGTVQWIP